MPTKTRLLLFRAFSNPEGIGPDFGMVHVTESFIRDLAARRQLAQHLREQHGTAGPTALEFAEDRPVWFRWFEEQEETLDALYDDGWALIPADAFSLPDEDESGQPVVCRTDCDVMVVCQRRFAFGCQLKNTDTELHSENLYWDDMAGLGL